MKLENYGTLEKIREHAYTFTPFGHKDPLHTLIEYLRLEKNYNQISSSYDYYSNAYRVKISNDTKTIKMMCYNLQKNEIEIIIKNITNS